MKLWEPLPNTILPRYNYITIESLMNMYKSKKRYFKAKPLGEMRLGNLRGSRGISELHGQKPFEKIYELIEE
jgi:hypothetical protein